MINVVVEKYCHNCPYFEPEIRKREDTITIKDPSFLGYHREILEEKRCICDTEILCAHRAKCNSIAMNIKEIMIHNGGI